jgi:hypothetical protein
MELMNGMFHVESLDMLANDGGRYVRDRPTAEHLWDAFWE